MKRWMILTVMMVLMMILGVAGAETTYSAPQRAEQLNQELDELPVIRTKQIETTITVTVDGPVDYLLANWQGYLEQPEEIELIDGVGTVETKGHRYQLGARWNNHVHYVTVENFFRYEDVSDDELREYFDALVAYGDARVAGAHPMEIIVKHLIPEYRIRRTIETYNAETNTFTKDAAVLEALPVSLVSDEELQKMIAELPDDTHEDSADGGYTDTWHAISESAYKSLGYSEGMNSDGSPDRAYLGTSGSYILAWGRSGKLKTATKAVSDLDCFGTGISGATSYIVWDNSRDDSPAYISDVVTYYPEGSDIASINAEYTCQGFLKKVTATYTDGRRETRNANRAGNVNVE